MKASEISQRIIDSHKHGPECYSSAGEDEPTVLRCWMQSRLAHIMIEGLAETMEESFIGKIDPATARDLKGLIGMPVTVEHPDGPVAGHISKAEWDDGDVRVIIDMGES